MKRIAEAFDWFFNKLLPKKFIVFITSTFIVVKGVEVPDAYWYILMIYIGGNVLSKLSAALKK